TGGLEPVRRFFVALGPAWSAWARGAIAAAGLTALAAIGARLAFAALLITAARAGDIRGGLGSPSASRARGGGRWLV
ncbi:MAG: hypothetical protein ACR2LS_10885, partial [Thermomicrobiales bacterium]